MPVPGERAVADLGQVPDAGGVHCRVLGETLGAVSWLFQALRKHPVESKSETRPVFSSSTNNVSS